MIEVSAVERPLDALKHFRATGDGGELMARLRLACQRRDGAAQPSRGPSAAASRTPEA